MDRQEIIDLLEKARHPDRSDGVKCECVACININQALTLLKQQPTVGDFTKRVRTQPYDPKWKHTLIIQTEDRDELCDRLDRAESKLKVFEQQPTAGEWTKIMREKWLPKPINIDRFLSDAVSTIAVACGRLDRAEAINKDLLDALNRTLRFGLNPSLEKIVEAAIAEAKKYTRIIGEREEEQ